MANTQQWQDSYWPLLMQAYMQKPAGMKTAGSRPIIDLAVLLHLRPKTLCERMEALERHESPSLQRVWDTYHNNTRRLNRDAKTLRAMMGFGTAGLFYDGVESADSFERFYSPIEPGTDVTPAVLTVVLGLYLSLTVNTMVADTPEVADMAKATRLTTGQVLDILAIYQTFDPILKRTPLAHSPIVDEARRVWDTYYNAPAALEEKVAQLDEYFK